MPLDPSQVLLSGFNQPQSNYNYYGIPGALGAGVAGLSQGATLGLTPQLSAATQAGIIDPAERAMNLPGAPAQSSFSQRYNDYLQQMQTIEAQARAAYPSAYSGGEMLGSGATSSVIGGPAAMAVKDMNKDIPWPVDAEEDSQNALWMKLKAKAPPSMNIPSDDVEVPADVMSKIKDIQKHLDYVLNDPPSVDSLVKNYKDTVFLNQNPDFMINGSFPQPGGTGSSATPPRVYPNPDFPSQLPSESGDSLYDVIPKD